MIDKFYAPLLSKNCIMQLWVNQIKQKNQKKYPLQLTVCGAWQKVHGARWENPSWPSEWIHCNSFNLSVATMAWVSWHNLGYRYSMLVHAINKKFYFNSEQPESYSDWDSFVESENNKKLNCESYLKWELRLEKWPEPVWREMNCEEILNQ